MYTRLGLAFLVTVAVLAGCESYYHEPAHFSDYIGLATQPAVTPAATSQVSPAASLGTQAPPTAPPASQPSTMPASLPVAGKALSLGVYDAILMALENNRQLIVQKQTPAIRRTVEQELVAFFDPVLTAQLAYQHERTDVTGRPVDRDLTTGSVGVSQNLPSGTTVGATLDVSHNSTPPTELVSQRAGLSVTQALLRGYGTDVNLAAVRQARLDSLATQYELRGFAEALVAQVEQAYWNYALTIRNIEVLTRSLELANQQLSEIRERIKVGKLAEIEVAASDAEVARRREELINGHSALAAARLQLVRLISPNTPDMWSRDVVLLNMPVPVVAGLEDIERHAQVAMRLRPDLNQARLAVSRGELEVIRTKNGLLPRLDAFMNLGKSSYSDSLCQATKEMFTDSNWDASVGLSLQLPVGNRAAEAVNQRAVLSKAQAADSVRNLEQLAQLDVRLAYLEVKRTWEQIGATAVTRRLQEESLRAESEKFRVGKSTSLQVSQAQRDLLNAQIAEIIVATTYMRAVVDFYRVEGSLLVRRGIAAPGLESPAEAARTIMTAPLQELRK